MAGRRLDGTLHGWVHCYISMSIMNANVPFRGFLQTTNSRTYLNRGFYRFCLQTTTCFRKRFKSHNLIQTHKTDYKCYNSYNSLELVRSY